MKRINFIIQRFSFFLGIVGFLLTAFSCKSPSKAFSVKPTELLSSSEDVFISVPKNADPEFLKTVISEFAGGISDKDLQQLMSRVEKAYCGLSEDKNGFSFQSVVQCNIPKSFASNIFTSKRGFSRLEYEVNKNKFEIFTQDKLNFSFPESNLLCISQGKSVSTMLDSYVQGRNTGFISQESYKDNLGFNYIDFLEGSNDEIRFFSQNPSAIFSMLSDFSNIPLNLNLKYISGNFINNPDDSESFLVSIDLAFENSKLLKAGKVLLGIAFATGKTEILLDSENPNLLTIKKLKINKKQLYKIFAN